MVDCGSIADAAFSELLSEHGFSRVGCEPNTFVRAIDNGRCDQHVDVEFHPYMNAFSVVLQEVCRDLSRRRQLLGEFEGEDFYRFDPHSIESAKQTISRALGHMSKYGLRWFDHEEIDTPQLRKKQREIAKLRFERMVREGRAAFKSGDLAGALRNLKAASEIGELDEVSRKYIEIAEKRLQKS